MHIRTRWSRVRKNECLGNLCSSRNTLSYIFMTLAFYGTICSCWNKTENQEMYNKTLIFIVMKICYSQHIKYRKLTPWSQCVEHSIMKIFWGKFNIFFIIIWHYSLSPTSLLFLVLLLFYLYLFFVFWLFSCNFIISFWVHPYSSLSLSLGSCLHIMLSVAIMLLIEAANWWMEVLQIEYQACFY